MENKMTTTNPALDRLKYLLQDEMSAVETYDTALTKVKDEAAKATLSTLKAVHEERLKTLTNMVKDMGGAPPTSSGLWGAFAKLVEGGAALLGEKAIVSALEECEIKSLADYKSDVEVFDEALHKLMFNDFMPSQQDCYEKIAKLHESMK
jgi:demethoxyubiquinone hydroxylase (CLK1/Coq7/Cat5 family)